MGFICSNCTVVYTTIKQILFPALLCIATEAVFHAAYSQIRTSDTAQSHFTIPTTDSSNNGSDSVRSPPPENSLPASPSGNPSSRVKLDMIRDTAAMTKNQPHPVDSNIIQLEKAFENKSREDLYREFFKTAPPPIPKQLDAALIINNETEELVEIHFSDDREIFSIPAAPVIKKLNEIAIPTIVDKVKAAIDEKGRITNKTLTALGLSTSFDSKDYQLKIVISAKELQKQLHNLGGRHEADPYQIESIKPNKFSAYLNIQANQQFKYRQSTTANPSDFDKYFVETQNRSIRQPFSCNFNSAVNIYNTVLENISIYEQRKDSAIFGRRDTRFIYDIPKKSLRISVGDIQFSTLGYFQSGLRLGGISIAKDFSLQPHILTYPVSDYEFFLSDPAEVEVWVDDVMVRRMDLDAGTHDIRGFPFSTGNNNVKIFIRDYSGRCDTTEFNFLQQSALLGAGKSQYSLIAGVPNQVNDLSYNYLFSRPALSLAFRHGFTNRLTGSIASQTFVLDTLDTVSLFMNMLGLGCQYALPFGTIDCDLGGVFLQNQGIDFATRVGFNYQTKVSHKNVGTQTAKITSLNTPLSCNTVIEYTGTKFVKNQFGMLTLNPEVLRLSSNLSIPLGDRFFISAGSRYAVRKDTADLFHLFIRLNKGWLQRLNTSLTFQYSLGNYGQEANPGIIANITWSFRSGKNDFSLHEEIKKHQPEVFTNDTASKPALQPLWDFNTGFQWMYDNSEPRPEKLFASLLAQLGPQLNDYNARVGYTGNQGSIECFQLLNEPQDINSKGKYLLHQTNLSFKTALVYADKTIALSRPVYGGFVLAKGVKNLKGSRILINPSEQGYEATSNRFGPAVLPLYAGYQLKRLNLFPLKAAFGTTDLKLNNTIFPYYKSGFSFKLGSEQNVVAMGTLLTPDKKPFAYTTISITEKDSKEAPIQTFTNGLGRFQFPGKENTTYEITSSDPNLGGPLSILIPKNADGIIQLGKIHSGSATNNETIVIPPQTAVPESIPLSLPDSTNTQSSPPTVKEPLTQDSVNTRTTDTRTTDTRTTDTSTTDTSTTDTSKTESNKPDTKLDIDDSATYVIGTLTSNARPIVHTAIAILSLENLSARGMTTFTNKNGDFQVICPQPGRYKLIISRSAAGANFSSVNFTVPADKRGFFYHLGSIALTTKAATQSPESPDAATPDAAQALPGGTGLVSGKTYVTGTLLDAEGQPLGFNSLSIGNLDDENATPMKTFTNSIGQFQAICDVPGRYRVFWTKRADGPRAIFDIPRGQTGIFELGSLKMTPEAN